MSTETPKNHSSSESEENSRDNFKCSRPGPSGEPLEHPMTSSLTIRTLRTRSLTGSLMVSEPELSTKDSTRIADIDINELYQRYNDLFRATFANVSQNLKRRIILNYDITVNKTI